MPTKVVFILDEDDFVPKRGVAVVAGWTADGSDGLRIVTIEETPVWDQLGLIESALQHVRSKMSRMWA
jgi:hypothetical protein